MQHYLLDLLTLNLFCMLSNKQAKIGNIYGTFKVSSIIAKTPQKHSRLEQTIKQI